jgi:hypothetical protein
MHVAPACVGSEEGSNHFGSYVRNIFLHFCKRLFPGLEPMTSWSQGMPFIIVQRITINIYYKVRVERNNLGTL